MARFNFSEADNYGGQGGSGFFSLKNDMDVARVRFLYNSVDDIEGHSVHEVEIDGKKRYIDCPRAYNDPVDKCPFCKSGKYVQAKLIIPLYDETDGKVKIWERGKKFFNKLTGICARYGSKNTIVSQVFEIERHGKAGDTSTEYEIFLTDEPADDTRLEDFEMPVIVGEKGFILTKSAEEMEEYLETGYFPNVEATSNRRSEDRRSEERPSTPVRRSGRRTPSNREDVY